MYLDIDGLEFWSLYTIIESRTALDISFSTA
jgi:hypothetical protein